LREFPEYRRDPANPNHDATGNPLVYVLGGFAALGNPASFHKELVRDLRRGCRAAILPLFQEMIGRYASEELRNETKFEILIDRMLYRLVSQQPSGPHHFKNVIWYHGNKLQHYKRRDKIKTSYCANSGWSLLRIHYKDISKLEELVTSFISFVRNNPDKYIITFSHSP
jgi:hypothetical protein